MKPSSILRTAVKRSELQQYRIAIAAGLHPDTLSKILNGAIPVYENDQRVLAVGKVLGLEAAQCFDAEKAVSS